MNKYGKKKNSILFIFIGFCLFTFLYICFAPPSTAMSLLVVLCLFFGYYTYIYTKDLKKKGIALEKRKKASQKNKRRQLPDKGSGKVLTFPPRQKKEPHSSQPK